MNNFELLDAEKIKSVIEPEFLGSLTQLHILETVDSTNSYLLSQGKMGAPSGSVCLAEQQTKGRGRLGRAWFSPYGVNLYCSLLWRFPTIKAISGLSIAIAVMVSNALRQYGISAGIQLKWPNDILFDGRKLGGILLESNDSTGIVIGIGLNLNLMPETEAHWITIQEITGGIVMRNYLAGLLINELLTRLPAYETWGLDFFIGAWQKQDVLVNKLVTVMLPNKTIMGKVFGINQQGELVLQQENGVTQCFCYGEVSIREGSLIQQLPPTF